MRHTHTHTHTHTSTSTLRASVVVAEPINVAVGLCECLSVAEPERRTLRAPQIDNLCYLLGSTTALRFSQTVVRRSTSASCEQAAAAKPLSIHSTGSNIQWIYSDILARAGSMDRRGWPPVFRSGRSFGNGQAAVMPCGWEGNRGSGVALAMRHRLSCFHAGTDIDVVYAKLT